MKKMYVTLGVLLASLGSTLSFGANHQSLSTPPIVKVAAASEASADQQVGKSIGTVDAQLYSESNLEIEDFPVYDYEYVAKISEDTYMGFYVNTSEDVKYAVLTVLHSSEESITVPDSLRIGDEVIPVTRIESYSRLQQGFTENIKNLTLPSTITYIYKDYSFDNYLKAIYMLGEAPNFGYYSNLRSEVIVYVCDRKYLKSYFANPNFDDSVIMPYGWDYEWITVKVEKGGEFAETYLTQNDYDWSAVQYIKITGNINDIDLNAIKNLDLLMKLDLSETSITSLPESFMYGKRYLLEVKLPKTLTTIEGGAFYNCYALQSFDLNGITTIESSVFKGCRSLSYVDLTGVETIGSNAFYRCFTLADIDLSTVRTIGSGAFADCKAIKSLDLPLVEDLAYACFRDCTGLEEISFGNRLTYIPNEAFYNTGIKNIVVPNGIVELGRYAFGNCKNLLTIDLPSTLNSIREYGFKDCNSLVEVNMKTGLEFIAQYAFHGCKALEDITIPPTVKFIGYRAFSDTNIKNFRCYAVVPPKAEEAFIGEGMDMSHTYLYVPPFSKDFYRNTKYWSDFFLMQSIRDQIDYILVDRPLTINLEEEDNEVVANNPEIVLSCDTYYDGYYTYINGIGQLTATGEGTLSAGHLTIDAILSNRYYNSSDNYCPTLINYADKMRADNVSHSLRFTGGNGGWHFISLPYDVKVGDIIPSEDTYWVIRRYDSAARAAGETSETWVNMTNDETMEAGKGYIVSATGGMKEDSFPRLTFTSGNSLTKNNIFRPNDVIVQLTEYPAEFAHNRSWNLIGNPYPCYFDMHCLNEEFTAPITVWNGWSYIAYSPIDDDLVLSPYEAFFVQCPLESNTITFKESGRMHSDEGKELYKSPAQATVTGVTAEERNVFNFEIASENHSDRARIVLNPEAEMQYEIGRDAAKFFAEDNDSPQIYVISDANYSINERPISDGVATLGIRAAKESACTLSLNGRFSREWQVMVTDNVTGITVDLTQQDYDFTVSSETSGNRFSIKFQLAGNSAIESIMTDFGKDSIVTISALNGISFYIGRLDCMSVPAPGLYIISNGQETRKAILK